MDKKEKALDFAISLLDSANYMLTLALIAILFVSGLFYYIPWKYGREPEQNPPETAAPVITTPEPVSPELMKVLDQQSTELVDGRYLITLEPYSDIPLNVYRTIKHADGKPFRITCGDQWAESGDGSCYCILNGEEIPTLEDLASPSYHLTQRLHTEKVLTPEELAVWDRYLELEKSRRITGEPQDVTQVLADELGMSRDDAFGFTYNIFRLCDGHHKRLTPHELWDYTIGMMGEYDPDPSGDYEDTLYFAMIIIDYVVDHHFHLEDQDKLNQMMTEAYEFLSEKQAEALPRNMPIYIAFIDEIMASFPEDGEFALPDYPTLDAFPNLSGSFHSALEMPGRDEDWERIKTALFYAAEQAENKAA